MIRKKERDGYRGGVGSRRPKNNSLQVEGVSKILANDIKIDLRKEKDEVRKYLNRIHHGGNRPEQYHQKVVVNRGLPPLRRWTWPDSPVSNLLIILIFPASLFFYLYFVQSFNIWSINPICISHGTAALSFWIFIRHRPRSNLPFLQLLSLVLQKYVILMDLAYFRIHELLFPVAQALVLVLSDQPCEN